MNTITRVLMLPILLICMVLFPSSSGTQESGVSYRVNERFPGLNYIESSSTLKSPFNTYRATNMVDGSWASWCEGKSDDGIGEYFILKFNKQVNVGSIFIKNGFGLKRDFAGNNRVKGLRVSADSGSTDAVLKDTSAVQEVKLDKIITGKNIKFTILSVHGATPDRDTCIGEISFRSIEIADTDLLPKFKSVQFMVVKKTGQRQEFKLSSEGPYGTVEGDICLGTQFGCKITGGVWTSYADGSASVDYAYKVCTYTPASKDMADIDCTTSPGTLKLKKFGVDAIVTDDGEIAEADWE